eukprot:16435021-Heterocapsa_arctica.AAC.1
MDYGVNTTATTNLYTTRYYAIHTYSSLLGRPYRCTCTGVHDKGILHKTYGHQQRQCWSVLLKLNIGFKQRCCAKRSASCEEPNGDNKDARRPFNNRQKPSYTHVGVHL